jgi:hypothetical protein
MDGVADGQGAVGVACRQVRVGLANSFVAGTLNGLYSREFGTDFWAFTALYSLKNLARVARGFRNRDH